MSDLANLRSRRRLAVPLGDAPDGLPWRLAIDRGASAAELLAPIGARLGYHSSEQYRGTPFEELVTRLEEQIHQRDVKTIDTREGPVECYVTGQRVSQILGPTLLSRVLRKTAVTEPPVEDTRIPAVGPATVIPPGQDPSPPPVRAEVGVGHLALPLNGHWPLIVSRTENPGSLPACRLVRPFVPESIRALRSAQFDLVFVNSGDHYSGPMSDVAAYRDARRRIARPCQPYVLVCQVARAELALQVAAMAECLYGLHQGGRIHGDFKPGNVLLTRSGVQVIDSLDLPPGARSPAMTPGWAAPEQVVGGFVGYATDQYAVGLLLCELLQGVIYGEEAHFIVPVGGSRTERFTLLRNPGVYLPPEGVVADPRGVEQWRGILDRCLRFFPEERFPDMAELAADIRAATEAGPLRGDLEMPPWFGSLKTDEDAGEPVWQVLDVR
ncbi:MAG TPA: hypothetical protein VMH81_22345 [Bryobacteraceae bacterium]|nr:hypothetical protein [Bryobacteraceae bacterium]